MDAMDTARLGAGHREHRSERLADVAPAQAPAAAARRRPIAIAEDDQGLLFMDRGNLAGAVRISGQTFQCAATKRQGRRGRTFWLVDGRGDGGDAVTGSLFLETGGSALTGRRTPCVTGHLTTVGGQVERRMAGWLRSKGSTHFYSLSLSTKPHEASTLPLRFGATP